MNDAPYDKMFQIIDELAPSLNEEVIIQTGNIEFSAKNCKTVKFLVDSEMKALFDSADLIIAHAGIGTILNGLQRNIPLVLVPRSVVMDADQDQQDIVARKIESMGRGVRVTSLDELPQKITDAKLLIFSPYKKNTSLCEAISKILNNIELSLKK
jgi:UDP-N-acetylglucosamine transferase subunit ALG13